MSETIPIKPINDMTAYASIDGKEEELPRTCGGCTMCCKIMGVSEIDKPRNVWCKHVAKDHKGCSIYGTETYPKACRSYACGWVQTTEFPEWMRPDKIHAIIMSVSSGRDGVTIHLDPGYPSAYLSPPLDRIIETILRGGLQVLVICNDKVMYKHPVTKLWTRAKTTVKGDQTEAILTSRVEQLIIDTEG